MVADVIINKNVESLVPLLKYFKPFIVSKSSKFHESYKLTIDKNEFIHDMETKFVEYTLNDYKLDGAEGHKACFTIFITRKIDRACLNYAKKLASVSRRFVDVSRFYGESDNEDGFDISTAPIKSSELCQESFENAVIDTMHIGFVEDTAQLIVAIITDGTTLSDIERKTLMLADPYFTSPPMTHAKIARKLGKSRPRISQLYIRAKNKIRAKLKSAHGVDENHI